MVASEMFFEGIIVDIVLLLAIGISSIANVTAFVAISAVGIQFVVAVEPLVTETTLRMSLETALIDGAGLVVAILFMFSQLVPCEKSVFVGEDLLVSGAKVTKGQFPLVGDFLDDNFIESIKTHHMTLLCLLFTCRCKSGQPRQATSQSSSGQLYRSSKTVSS